MRANQNLPAICGALLAAAAIWPLGSARPSLWAGFGVLLCAVLIADMLAHRASVRIEAGALKVVAVLVAALIGYAALQATPVAPAHIAHPAWGAQAVAVGDNPPAWAAISANPSATVQATLLGVVTALFAIAGLTAARQGRTAYRALDLVLGSITLAALASLVLIPFGNPFPWLSERWAYADRPAGPFVNPNMFGFLCGAGVLLSGALGMRVLSYRIGAGAGWRADFADLVAALAGRAGAYLLSLLVCLHALLATASRNALGSLAIAAAVMLVAAVVAARGRGSWALVLAALVTGLIVVVSPAGGLLAERMAWASVDERFDIYGDIVTAVRANPLLGHGLGTFEDAFPVYQSSFRPGGARVLYAHSFWLGLAFDIGLIGLLLGASVALAGLTHFAGQILRRRSPLDVLALGLIALTVAFGVLDDPFQTPGAVFAVAFILGVGGGSQRRWACGG